MRGPGARGAGRGWRAGVAIAAALATFGCSSDDFGRVGSSLPLDVSQDSLLIELPPIEILETRTVRPDLAEPVANRQILYLGNRPEGGWRATPVLRFDLSTSIPDTILTSVEDIVRVRLDFEALKADADAKPIARSVRVYDLADTLVADDASATAIADLIGDEIVTDDVPSGSSVVVDLPREVVYEWLQARAHRGVALYDLTADFDRDDHAYDSNMIGLAGREFLRFSLLDQLQVGEIAVPELQVELPGNVFYNFRALVDFTVIERDAPSTGALVLGSFDVTRSWLRFDLGDDVIPGNATINRALLELHVEPTGTIGARNRSTLAYEALDTAVDVGAPAGSDQVLRSASSVALIVPTDSLATNKLTVDVTDFVQRAVNLVVPPEAGILLRFSTEENFQLDVATFYGLDADPALRPKLTVTFTPPADTWR